MINALNKHTKSILGDLIYILQGGCHDPACTYVPSECPIECPCNRTRQFKLNTETAMCWQIASWLADIKGLPYSYLSAAQVQAIVHRMEAYKALSYYHMTKGWENFFDVVHRILYNIVTPPGSRGIYINDDFRTYEESITHLKRVLPKLKREPR